MGHNRAAALHTIGSGSVTAPQKLCAGRARRGLWFRVDVQLERLFTLPLKLDRPSAHF